ncbi:MAG TPA: glycosyltransferase [Candidatus Paceibacterota bacterium]|jgi:glycosyltransferase involved in cell wall biosynthesis
MKVLVATPLYPPQIGGPATYAARIERELPAKGIAVTMLPFSSVAMKTRIVRHALYFLGILRKARGADVVYALDSTSVGIPALIAAKLCYRPLVVRIGGIGSWERAVEQSYKIGPPHEFANYLQLLSTDLRQLYRLERMVWRQARTVVVPSEYLKQSLVLLGIPAERITVIYNGMEPVPDGTDRVRIPGLIVSAGRLAEIKRFDVLVEAVRLIAEDLPDARLHIYGSGPTHDALEAAIRQAGMEGRIELRSALPRMELLERIGEASVFALASWHETFSNLLIESMAVGTPVVSTAAGGTPEVVNSGVNGLLVPPGDAAALAAALRKVLMDAAYGMRLAGAARASLSMFSGARVVERTCDVLADAVS